MPQFPGTPGDDILYGTDDPDTMTGLAGNDRLFGFGGDDILDGGDDSDILEGGTGADSMTGGSGNDFYIVDNPGDVVIELTGGGAELVFTYIDYTLPDNVERLAVYSRSSTYAINLTGNALNNELIGNDGANFLDGGDGQDIMQGAGGNDEFLVSLQGTVTVSARPSASSLPGLGYMYLNSTQPDTIHETVGAGTDTIWVPFTGSVSEHGYFDYTLIKGSTFTATNNVENVGVYDPASTYAVNLQGDWGNNQVSGNDGRNILDGYTGTDTLIGNGGDDIYFAGSDDTVIEGAGDGNDTLYLIRGPVVESFTLPANVERLFSTDGVRILTGNALDNEISGNGLDNLIDGGAGADKMSGLDGNDTYVVDNVGDVIGETSGVDTVNVALDYTLDSSLENLVGRGTIGLRLTGHAGANGIHGTTGHDIIDGGAGDDRLEGDRGNDVFLIDSTSDQLIEAFDEGFDTVYSSVSYSLGFASQGTFGHVERLGAIDRSSMQAIDLTGNQLDNEIWGNDGANVIDGRESRDILQGLGGADRFVFSTVLTGYSNIDQLIDFLAGTDTIALDDAIFQALAPGALAASSFRHGTEAQDADDFIMYDPTTGFLYYDADANGSDRYAVPFAVMHETTPLTAADFLII